MDFKVKNLSKKEALQKKNFYVNKKSYAFRKKKNYVAKKMYSQWKKIYNSKKKFTWVKLKITRRPRRPKKKYIRFVYYAKKILRWKKINNYRSKNCKLTKTSRLVKKSPRNYTWEHFWRKRKIKKKSRLWHNFSFFLKKQRPANLLKYNIRVKWLYIQKKRVHKYYSRRVPKKKLSLRGRDTFKKKLYFKKFLIKYYNFRRVFHLKSIHKWAFRKPGNNVINFFLSLESQISSVCLRMHFFWTLKKSRNWVKSGVVHVNGKSITFPRHATKINDLVTVSFQLHHWRRIAILFRRRRRSHKKYRKSLNNTVLSYRSISGIIFTLPYKVEDIKLKLKKRKKHWLKTRVFSYLVNSFH